MMYHEDNIMIKIYYNLRDLVDYCLNIGINKLRVND